MKTRIELSGLGNLDPSHGWIELERCSDGVHKPGKNGVTHVVATGDRKVELIGFKENTIALVNSELGYPAYYPLRQTDLKRPVKAVLMDLDGTTVRSEEFWIWIIERTVASLLEKAEFHFVPEDIPYVSGHSVSEHLMYCIEKYAPKAGLEDARTHYMRHTDREMELILAGKGRPNAFTPSPGIKEFLLELKKLGIKLALVTSGLYRKAYPEILSAFETLELGNPEDFYDCIVTAGYSLGQGRAGTMGELNAKPHPWLYAEACRVGLGIEDRESVIGIEDSGAGVCAVRLAGYYTVGISGGNIRESGTRGMCNEYYDSFEQILRIVRKHS
jgi:beta-phosphoglucomutase-like phosphatase (HAD superfamily)